MEPCKVTSGTYIKRFCKEFPFETSVSRLVGFQILKMLFWGELGYSWF